MAELFCILLVVCTLGVLLLGFPVAFSLSGTALLIAALGYALDIFDNTALLNVAGRIYGNIMTQETLVAVPLFVFMGVMLERSKIAERLLDTMAGLFMGLRGGLSISVIFVGLLLGASTGIVGATVVTMGLISLPTMLRHGYDPSVSAGTICASGTLGQIIPPSIVLVLLGGAISNEYSNAQTLMGNYSPDAVSIGDLFIGAIIPGLILVGLYCIYIFTIAVFKAEKLPATPRMALRSWPNVLMILLPPLALIFAVLGSIMFGIATPTESASVGAVGAMLLAMFSRQLDLAKLIDVMRTTTQVSSMVFLILIGATIFSAVFRGFQGDEIVRGLLTGLPGGAFGAMLTVMLVMFVLGFFLDFFEITFVVIPIVATPLLMMGLDPIWLGVMFAMNLQTSFLTPPFGFSLFYLRGVAPASISTMQIYRGVIPFVVLQIVALIILAVWPGLATWLPNSLFPS